MSLKTELVGNLGGIIGKDLAGFRISPVFWLELEHGRMGFFPARTARDAEMVVVTERTVLRIAWEKLPRRRAKIRGKFALIHPEMEIGFIFHNDITGEEESIRVFSREGLEQLAGEAESPFEWTPGLLQVADKPVRDPDFGC